MGDERTNLTDVLEGGGAGGLGASGFCLGADWLNLELNSTRREKNSWCCSGPVELKVRNVRTTN